MFDHVAGATRIFSDKDRATLFFVIKHELAGSQLSDTKNGVAVKRKLVSQASNAIGSKKSGHCLALLKSQRFLKVYHSASGIARQILHQLKPRTMNQAGCESRPEMDRQKLYRFVRAP